MELKRVRTADVYPSEANPRRDFGDLDALAASFELNPRHPGEPMNPPLLVRDGEVYRIVDGERRWRAMSKAGTKVFDAVVCDDWADADAALAMLATDDKKPLDEVERSRGVQRALLLGVEPQKVEKAARRKGLRRVGKAAEMVGAAAETMSLDHLLAVADLARYPDLAAKVADADEASWERAAKEARKQVEDMKAAEALRAAAERLGIQLVEGGGRPDGTEYVETCREPGSLDAASATEGAVFVFQEGNGWDGPRVVVYAPDEDDEGEEDAGRQAAAELADSYAAGVDEMLAGIRAFLAPKAMADQPREPSACMAAAVSGWLGKDGSRWSERANTDEWLDEAGWDGARPDGLATGMVAAALLRAWVEGSRPRSQALLMAAGQGVMQRWAADILDGFLAMAATAESDGWEPTDADRGLMAALALATEGAEREDEDEEE